jgi:hypothetical protein
MKVVARFIASSTCCRDDGPGDERAGACAIEQHRTSARIALALAFGARPRGCVNIAPLFGLPEAPAPRAAPGLL